MEAKNAPVVFCDWIKRRRKALDMTQGELAQRVGCSIGALRKIESGDRRPSKQLAELLAKALEIPKEDQQTFIRVARGELNLERLGGVSPATSASAPDVDLLRQSQQSLISGARYSSLTSRIPIQTTPLIGRDVELAAMEKIFIDPQCRLLTLTGVGGIGKTRLAVEFASRSASIFPGGIVYIPLAAVNSAQEIIPAIADVLEFGFSGPSNPKEQLLNYLSNQIKLPALFILDNLEQLLTHGLSGDPGWRLVELICDVLQQLPTVKILSTSRERLNLHGEWTYELHGLSVPSVNFVGRLEEYSSADLFIKSAQRVRADFQAIGEEQSALIRICQVVDGVPLAIELAAAWVGLLSCQEIAEEIQSNMDFLTTSMRDIPERHRSIRATFDHSWNLLSDEERQALCQLSVFHGGFDRTAAVQVAGASLALLASLIAKSLVRRTESGRYDLHEVIRQYSASHLHGVPCNLEAYDRHCDYYLTFLCNRQALLKSRSQQETMRQLADEIDNLRAAWVWAINRQKFASILQAGRAYGWYFEIAGLYNEGIDQLEMLVRALKIEGQEDQWSRLVGLARLHQGLLFFRKGEFGRAQELYEDSIVNLRRSGERTLLADSLGFLGTILHLQGEYGRARSLLEEGLSYARQSNERWFEAWAIYNLGHLDGLLGHYSQGYEQMLVGLAMWRELGDPQSIALGLNFLIPTLNVLCRFGEAKTYMYESIDLCEQSKNSWGMGTAYRFLGSVNIAEGQYAQAEAHLLKSLEIFGEFAVGWDIARSLAYLGDAARMEGNYPEARKYYQNALQSSIEANAIPIALDTLLGLSCLQSQVGDVEYALLLCYFVLNHPSSEGGTRLQAEELRAALEPGLDPVRVKTLHRMAAEYPFDEIVKLVLDTA